MKIWVIVLAAAAIHLFGYAYSSQADNGGIKNFSLYVKLGEQTLIGGQWDKDLINGLTPAPNSILGYNLGLGFDWYFSDTFGVSLGYDADDELLALSPQTDVLDVSSSPSIKALFLMRFLLSKNDNQPAFFFRIFAGPNFTFFNISPSLKSLIESSTSFSGNPVSFYNGPATGFGFTGGFGIMLQKDNFGYGIDFTLDDKNVEFSGASQGIDLVELGFSTRVCFDF